MYVCVFVGHGLRSTSFVLGVAKKSEVPICSARTSLTNPSSFCQAGTRTTAGDPWLCKLQSHCQIVTGLQYFKHHRFTANEDNLFFLIVPVPVDPPQYYWPLLHVSRFLYSLNKRSQARPNLFSNTREVPAKTSNPARFALSRDAVSGDFYWLTSYLCQSLLYMRIIVL